MDSTSYLVQSADMQFRRGVDFYPAGGPSGKSASSAGPRSDDTTHGHPCSTSYVTAEAPSSSTARFSQHSLYSTPRYRNSALQYGSPQSWPPYEGLAVNMASGLPSSWDSFPTASPYPPPRLSPPPSSLSFGGFAHTPRPLAGSLDPNTGIFYRTPDHPRLRTAQACEKCRSRKAKCSGEHPSCKRCISRSLVCEYAKEGRVRGPNKPKVKTSLLSPEDHQSTASRSTSTNTSRSTASPDYFAGGHVITSLRESRSSVPHHPGIRLLQPHRPSLSLGEHRPNRPRPPNLHLESTSNFLSINVYGLQFDFGPGGTGSPQ
ncbi:hypothetical protein NMY22_g19904 [Coprinellus aureogranulatus]|nr:hypothetical protein NMY22_g19904 [Coprinellus aureogranulatus]